MSSLSQSLLGLIKQHQYKHISLIVFAATLLGCEARLDLSGVDQTLTEPVRRTDQLLEIVSTHSGRQLVFGDNGLLLSREGNQGPWTRTRLGDDQLHPNFIGADVCADGTVVALAYQGQVWTSTNEGADWSSVALPTAENVQAIHCTPANERWVVGSFSTLLRSADGVEWSEDSQGEDAMLTGIQFVSAGEGYAYGEFGLLLKTQDGGDSWEILDPIGNELYPLAAHFTAEGNAWVGSLKGVIMASTDGGQSWQRQDTETEVPIYNFIANGSMYATGDRGTVLRLSGDTWTRVEAPEIPTYYRTGLVTADDGLLIAGGWGVLLPLNTAANPN